MTDELSQHERMKRVILAKLSESGASDGSNVVNLAAFRKQKEEQQQKPSMTPATDAQDELGRKEHNLGLMLAQLKTHAPELNSLTSSIEQHLRIMRGSNQHSRATNEAIQGASGLIHAHIAHVKDSKLGSVMNQLANYNKGSESTENSMYHVYKRHAVSLLKPDHITEY